MLLYHLHDWQHAALAPFRFAAEATQAAFQNPFFPASHIPALAARVAAGAELFERTTRRFGKPSFGLETVRIFREPVKVEEEIVMRKAVLPACCISSATLDAENDPRVLIVAPMSGHHATLLRGTVEAMLPDHDVYITDWIDAKMVPLSQGKFDLEDYVYLRHGIHSHAGAGCASGRRVPAGAAGAGGRGACSRECQ